MRSWTPRRPSASRRAEIFSRAADISPDADLLSPASAVFLRSVLAPALACVLLTLAVFNHGGDARPAAVAWGGGSNFMADASRTAQNRWECVSSATFEWTNRGVFRSSMPFTPDTNLTH